LTPGSVDTAWKGDCLQKSKAKYLTI